MKTLPGPGKRLSPDMRRRAILDAAIGLFGRDGYSSVSAAEIARHAGVTAALVHHYFGPKRNIYLAILAEWQQIMVSSLNVDRALPFHERVDASAASWYEQIARYPAIWLATDSQGGSPDDADIAAVRDAVRAQAVGVILQKFDDVVHDTPGARWALMGFTGHHDIVMRAHLRGEIDAEMTVALLAEGLRSTLMSVIPGLDRAWRTATSKKTIRR